MCVLYLNYSVTCDNMDVLEDIILSEISQSQRDKYYFMIPLIY